MMRLSWVELSEVLSGKLQQNDYQDLTPLLENVRALNKSYATKPLYFDRIDSCIKALSDKSLSNEKITENIQALCDCMLEVIADKIKPLMYKQVWFMEKMTALGYKITGQGECYGISHMAIQAFLANDMETFNKRLQTIYHMPIEDFKNDFANLREKKQYETIVDLYAFFDGIALNQMPIFYLLDKDDQPIYRKQDVSKTRPITMPKKLETETAKGEYNNKPSIIATFSGVYSEKNLVDYLDLLKNTLGEHSFALNLTGIGHAITLIYDNTTSRWLLFDPSNLPGEEYIHSKQLADALFSDFSQIIAPFTIDNLLMKTQITTIVQHEQQMQAQFESLSKTKAWLELNDISKMNEVDGLQLGLYQRLENEMDDLQLLTAAIVLGQHDFVGHFLDSRGVEPFKEILEGCDTQKLIDLLRSMSLMQQHNLLEQLNINKKAELLSSFHDLFKILPAQERLAVFRILHTGKKSTFLLECPEEAPLLLKQLSTKEKADITSYYSRIQGALLFQTLPVQERLNIFLEWKPLTQGQYLSDLSEDASMESDTLIASLSTEKKVEIILGVDPDEKCRILILASMTEDEQFDLVSSNFYTFKNLPRPELEKIILKVMDNALHKGMGSGQNKILKAENFDSVEKQMLISAGVKALKKHVAAKINGDFIDNVNNYIDLIEKAHELDEIDFRTALNKLSKAAALLDNPNVGKSRQYHSLAMSDELYVALETAWEQFTEATTHRNADEEMLAPDKDHFNPKLARKNQAEIKSGIQALISDENQNLNKKTM